MAKSQQAQTQWRCANKLGATAPALNELGRGVLPFHQPF